MTKSTFAYYRLTDYYQNHRRYVKSRDDVQLLAATKEQLANPANDCSPYDKNGTSGDPIGKFITDNSIKFGKLKMAERYL